MNNLSVQIDNREFFKVYKEIFSMEADSISVKTFDFLFQCNPITAYDFLEYCLALNTCKCVRLAFCEFLMYGDFYLDNLHSTIYSQIMMILEDDPLYYPALEFVIYNYYEHPESPFVFEQLTVFAKSILQDHSDNVALKIIKAI